MRLRLISFTSLIIAISVLYGNCQKTQESSSSSLGVQGCEDSLRVGFTKSYHPFTKQQCGLCHNATNIEVRGKAFGDPNAYVAFKVFKDIGEQKIRAFALDSAHQGGRYNGPFNSTAVTTARTSWNQSLTTYNACMAAATGRVPPPPPLVTSNKNVDMSLIRLQNKNNAPCVTTPASCNLLVSDFKTITWNIGTEVTSGTPISGVTFSIKVAVVNNGAATTATPPQNDYALLITNPTISNQSGSNIQIKNIGLNLNGEFAYDGTTFSIVDKILTNGQTQDLALFTNGNVSPITNSGVMLLGLGGTLNSSGYTLGAVFEVLSTTALQPVVTPPSSAPTFASLFGTNGSLRAQCITCHGATPAVGTTFRLDTYTNAMSMVIANNSANSRLYQKINGTAVGGTPMPPPPAALLPVASRDLVRAWIDGGALP